MENKASIAVFSTKGGVGKTSLSYSLTKDLGYNFITNDFSNAASNFGRNAQVRLTGKIPLRKGTLYDFGGFRSEFADEILREVDLIIIPTIDDFNAMMKCMEVINKFKEKKIIVVANAIEKEASLISIKLILMKHFPDIEVFSIPSTKLFKNALEQNLSAAELYKTNKIYERGFRNYLKLLHRIKDFEKEVANV